MVRMSDFKTNEYAELIGGAAFEPEEENPMLGWRGASRYYDDDYREGFALECRALRMAREEIGLSNIVLMIPFCRTLAEADRGLLETLAEEGLVRGRAGLSVYVMAEIPANVFLAEEFAKRFDGFSIGSNDLTQLVLGVDRDSDRLRRLFDERDEAVKAAICRPPRQGEPRGNSHRHLRAGAERPPRIRAVSRFDRASARSRSARTVSCRSSNRSRRPKPRRIAEQPGRQRHEDRRFRRRVLGARDVRTAAG